MIEVIKKKLGALKTHLVGLSSSWVKLTSRFSGGYNQKRRTMNSAKLNNRVQTHFSFSKSKRLSVTQK